MTIYLIEITAIKPETIKVVKTNRFLLTKITLILNKS